MPAKRQRLTFMPSAETLSAIERIAVATKQPVSSIVAESMDLLTAHLTNLAAVLEEAHALSADAKAVIFAAAEGAADQLRPHMLEARRVMADLSRSIDDAVSASDAEPPSSNTGVTLADEPLLPLDRAA